MSLGKATLDVVRRVQEKLEKISLLGIEWKYSGKWLRSGIVRYTDPAGKERTYEMVERVTRCEAIGVDGTDIIAISSSDSEDSSPEAIGPKKLCLVAVYRSPVGKVSLEFPSGLIDPGETLVQGAERELLEETGYHGTIESVSPVVYADPWKSTENTALCVAKVDASRKRKALKLDEDEFLEPLELPLQDLRQQLDILQKDHGLIVDVKLYAFAMGLEMQNLLVK